MKNKYATRRATKYATPNGAKKNNFHLAYGLGLLLLFASQANQVKAEDFQVASYIEDKVHETITSPVKRFKERTSHRFQSFKSRIKHNREIEATAGREDNSQSTDNKVILSQTNRRNSFDVAPEISPTRQSPQFEAQVDEMVLAQWKRPAKVAPGDWEQILASVKQVSKRTGIPQQIVMSLINKESGFNPSAVSSSGAIGLTQVMPTTAFHECGLRRGDLYDIDKNINCGITYLDKLIQTFKRVDLAIAAYNAGPGAVRRAIEQTGSDDINTVTAKLKPETAPYVRKILASINYGGDCI